MSAFGQERTFAPAPGCGLIWIFLRGLRPGALPSLSKCSPVYGALLPAVTHQAPKIAPRKRRLIRRFSWSAARPSRGALGP